MLIDTNTKIYGSFSQTPGNSGNRFFNSFFQKNEINAIYKSFYSADIEESMKAAKHLNFSGFAIAMPYKKIAFKSVDSLDETSIVTGSVNTVLVEGDTLRGFNTDYIAASRLLDKYSGTHSKLYVLGDGGLGNTVIEAGKRMQFTIESITRKNWEDLFTLRDSLVFNCTPLNLSLDVSNIYIDCIIGTSTGDEFHQEQAKEQLRIYGYSV
jgi:shikimate 5-dehydrogenase